MNSIFQKQKEYSRHEIEFYRDSFPDVFSLALLACPARKIEPELLRCLRLELGDFFQLDKKPNIESESALWFSNLVESRGSDSITLLPGVSDFLRDQLKENTQLLEQIRRIILKCHQSVPPVIAWEEDLVYYSLSSKSDDDYQKHINKKILEAAKAVQNGERKGLDEWISRMYARIPQRLSKNENFIKLLAVSQRRITTTTELADVSTDASTSVDILLKIKRIGNHIEIGKSVKDADFQISVPDIQLITLIIQGNQGTDQNEVRIISDEETVLIDIIAGRNPLVLQTADGRIYKIPTEEDAVVRIINDAKINQTKELNLSSDNVGKKLTSKDLLQIMPEIKVLKNLNSLDLSFNSLTEIAFLSELKDLSVLNLIGNQISDASSLRRLSSLNSLRLSNNPISDATFVKNLTSLTSLELSQSQIKDFSFIGELTSLTALYLSDNRISDLSFVKNLTSLTTLFLYGNNISDISFLKELSSLTSLYLDDNQITDIFSLKSLKSLTSLNLQSNQIEDASVLKELSSLRELNLSDNRIDNISFLKELKGLTSLKLSRNRNLNLPENLEEKSELNRSDISKIIRYIEELEEDVEYIYEAKILVIGEPDSGKTTLVQSLIDHKFPILTDNRSTIGIEVKTFEFPYSKDEGKTVTAHIWDFGGQEIQYVLHQYFFTENSLYVLVIDGGKRELAQLNYWFEIIAALGRDCPVLVVLNENRGRTVTNFSVDAYQKEFGGLLQSIEEVIVDVSIDDGRIKLLGNKIKKLVSNLKNIGSPLPKKWVEVRRDIERLKTQITYIDIDDYFKICRRHQLTNKEHQRQLLNYLHDLGVVLNFKNDTNLRNTLILNPNWVIDSLYIILKSNVIRTNNGVISIDHIEDLWTVEGYGSRDRRLLLYLMETGNFEIAYRLPNTNNYVIPMLLPYTPSNYEFEDKNTIQIYFRYEFLPKGIVTRLIVKLHSNILIRDGRQLVWNEGVLLSHYDSIAEVIEITHLRQITIKVSGKNFIHNRELLTIIRNDIIQIHRDWFNNRLIYDEFVPCICSVCKYAEVKEKQLYKLSSLESRLVKGRKTIECHISSDDVNIRQLLEGVYVEDRYGRDLENPYTISQGDTVFINQKPSSDLMKSQNEINQIEKRLDEIFARLDTKQTEEIKTLINALVDVIENKVVKLNKQEDEQFKELQEAKSDTNLKTKLKLSLPLIPLLSVNYEKELEISKNTESTDIIKSLKKILYNEDEFTRLNLEE